MFGTEPNIFPFFEETTDNNDNDDGGDDDDDNNDDDDDKPIPSRLRIAAQPQKQENSLLKQKVEVGKKNTKAVPRDAIGFVGIEKYGITKLP